MSLAIARAKRMAASSVSISAMREFGQDPEFFSIAPARVGEPLLPARHVALRHLILVETDLLRQAPNESAHVHARARHVFVALLFERLQHRHADLGLLGDLFQRESPL